MKADIHPTYYKKVIATCACGTTYEVGSTMESITTEICAACHPFYTGKQKLLDTAGQVDKFLAKMKKAAQAKVPAKGSKPDQEEAMTEELLENVESPFGSAQGMQAVLVETTMPAEEVMPKVEKKPVVKKTKTPVRAQNLAPRLSAKKVAPKKAAVKVAKKPAAKKPVKAVKKVTSKKKTSKK